MPPSSPARLAFLALLPALALAAGCGQSQTQAQNAAPPPPQVTVSKPLKKLVAEHDEYVGRFVAVDYVEVRARVSGYLEAIHFTDGQLVKKGDLLFTIDRRPFQATLAQAKAASSRPAPISPSPKPIWRAAQSLVRGTTITQQTFDQRMQAKRVAEAARGRAGGGRAPGRARFEFTELARAGLRPHRRPARLHRQPRDRRRGGNTTLLATIASVDPIRFEFTMDEASYLRYMRLAADGRR